MGVIVIAAGAFGCSVNRAGLGNGDARSDVPPDVTGTTDRTPDVSVADTGGVDEGRVDEGRVDEGRDVGVTPDAGLDTAIPDTRPDVVPDLGIDLIVTSPPDAADAPADRAPDAPSDGTAPDAAPDEGTDGHDDGGDAGVIVTCGVGSHVCGVTCALDTSTASCGASCLPCAAPGHGRATCDGVGCGFVCDSGFHTCGQGCASDFDTATCGASCLPCTAPDHAAPTCDGVACDFVCQTGTNRCNDHCALDTDPLACGPSCMACPPPPPNAVATCDGISCGFTCMTGFHDCGGACVSNMAVSSCGPSSCTACPAPANGTATCDGTSCGIACDVNMAPQGGACVNGCMVCDMNAIPVDPPGGRFQGTTSGQSNNTGSCGGGAAPDVVFKLTLTTASDVFISSHGSKFNTIVYMRRSCCGGDNNVCNDDADGRTTSVLRQRNLAAGTYYIFLDGLQGAQGDYVMDIYATPTTTANGDACGSPIRIANSAMTGNSCMLTQNYDPPAGCMTGPTANSGPDAVYYFVLDTTSQVSFNTCNNTCVDTILYVRDVCTVPSPAQGLCNDDGCSSSGCSGGGQRQSQLGNITTLSPGAHYLFVDTHMGAGSPCGTFTVTPTGIPN